MLQRRASKIKPNKFKTMVQKVGSDNMEGGGMAFFDGFAKAAGMVDSARNILGKTMPRRMAATASEGNVAARANTVKNTMTGAAKDTKQKVKSWTPDSDKPFNKVMEEEMPRVPNWKLKLQGAHG